VENINAYVRVAAFVNGLEGEEDLQDVYYAPGVHVPLVSLGKLEARDGTFAHTRAGGAAKSGWGPVHQC